MITPDPNYNTLNMQLGEFGGERMPCPNEQANFVSKFTFHWMHGLLRLGFGKILHDTDLPSLPTNLWCETSYSKFEKEWEKERRSARPSLLRCFHRSFGKEFWFFVGSWRLLQFIFFFATPVLLKLFLNYLQQQFDNNNTNAESNNSANDNSNNRSEIFIGRHLTLFYGLALAVAMFISAVFQTTLLQWYYHAAYLTALKVRACMLAMTFKKSLRISSTARRAFTAGEMVNFMSIDAQRLLDIVWDLHNLWSAPLQIIFTLGMLCYQLGVSALVGFSIMVLLIPVNYYLMKWIGKFQEQFMALSDKRMGLVNEVLQYIRLIKVYAWEESFVRRVDKIRNEEIRKLTYCILLRCFNSFLWNSAPVLVTVGTFGAYTTFFGNTLTVPLAFVSLALFNNMRQPLAVFPETLSDSMLALISVQRLQRFLLAEELDGYPKTLMPGSEESGQQDESSEPAIIITNGEFAWDKVTTIDSKTNEDGLSTKLAEPTTGPAVTLRNIDVLIPKGKLVMVVGKVGSAKSSFLASILGEIPKLRGEVTISGVIAYTSQQPWIFNDTVRGNILFGLPFDEDKYNVTLRSCALVRDLEILKSGDQTEIGEKGLNLSGGQKQRVSLARAVYRGLSGAADIFLFDEPLGAVDAHVGKSIFLDCITGVLQGKTRILVTHQLQFLPYADMILVMEDGAITHRGTFNELQERGVDFTSIVAKAGVPSTSEGKGQPIEQNQLTAEQDHSNNNMVENEGDSNSSTLITAANNDVEQGRAATVKEQSGVEDVTLDEESQSASKLISSEERQSGSVRAEVYLNYIRYAGGNHKVYGFLILLVVFTSFCIAQGVRLLSDYWLVSWSDDSNSTAADSSSSRSKVMQWVLRLLGQDPNNPTLPSSFYLKIYALLAVFYGFLVLARQGILMMACLSAANTLQKRLLRNIIRAPTSFFDATPIGRILNRMSKDQNAVDVTLPIVFSDLLSCLIMVLSGLLVIVFITPLVLIPLIPTIIVYWFVQHFYRKTSRELKRLESISRSPIYSFFQEIVGGISTVRAYKMQESLSSRHFTNVDDNQRVFFYSVAANRWLGIRLEFISSVVLLFAALLCVAGRNYLEPGLAGLALTNALAIAGVLNWFVRMAVEAEIQMNAVERILYYTTEVKQEAPAVLPSDKELLPNNSAIKSHQHQKKKTQKKKKKDGFTTISIDGDADDGADVGNNEEESILDDGNEDSSAITYDHWPAHGKIEFRDLVMRYRPNRPPVLKGISCVIHPGEKVGIVGRTGAGKSSLTQAIFRMVEATSGCILIDDIDIAKVGLYTLRSGISMIPQDPVLFKGTIRSNLDPANSGKYTDKQLWDALERSHLKEFVERQELKLDSPVDENGSNLSAGQQQLISLARALLLRNKILILDEATASLDYETDSLVQQTIRREFSECTILTIAHRLSTIMDSDRVMVMDNGHIAEFDSPKALLNSPSSMFSKLVSDAQSVVSLPS
eukprot:GEZU01008213.1.p1 GENE.GEZU01008213.1~~GEZU01008213.1.p1  ORF type:complete len:1468 (-),score=330.07 GEZU01008213.1:1647-6050(-)